MTLEQRKKPPLGIESQPEDVTAKIAYLENSAIFWRNETRNKERLIDRMKECERVEADRFRAYIEQKEAEITALRESIDQALVIAEREACIEAAEVVAASLSRKNHSGYAASFIAGEAGIKKAIEAIRARSQETPNG